MSKVIIHIEIEDCFNDCPFCSSPENKMLHPICTHALKELPSDAPIDPPDWCRWRMK